MRRFEVWSITNLVLFGCLIVVGVVGAESQNSVKDITQHLEFLGYQCEKLDQGIKATHNSKLGFVLIVLKDGLMAQSALAGKPKKGAGSQGSEKLATVNALNKESTISRFFWADSGELVVRASVLGGYEKSRFYSFMEAWEKDGQTIGKHYEALKPYIK